jgi:hypothetical protein
MTVEEQPSEIDGYRFFVLGFEQPSREGDPPSPRFSQRLTLLHRDRSAPVVLATSGYYGSLNQARGELGRMLQANVIRTEQRYFLPSRPEPADWADLTIELAAGDHHRVVAAMRPYYDRSAWLSTGASKGGMTSIYHERFHPEDIDAVVAYVAPISYGRDDARYVDFLASVGDAGCRDKLAALQRIALTRRAAMMERLNQQAASDGLTFERLGQDAALEGAVIELPFAFWQYYGAELCSELPGDSAPDQDVYDWVDEIAGLSYGSDQGIAYFEPYYYQAFTQLGYPAAEVSHLAGMLQAGELPVAGYLPAGVDPDFFDDEAMPDIQDWVATEGEQLMFIYGENDPWTAGKFELGDAVDAHLFVVPGGNHGSGIEELPAEQRDEALGILARWAGVTPTLRERAPDEPDERRLLRELPVRAALR